ncbi:hypothetical protein FBEOM_3048 [Fusarium beomiforme]|uniref:Uncharacterized protein n=1 Tax=Fusarium beomiforme TaxID=44412 RepID=A0A9P5E2A6_9HYPO|nr:hypothetical protein FBEOM_3048 [Fusarium beomiforme]
MWSVGILSRVWQTIQPQKAKVSLSRVFSRLGFTGGSEDELLGLATKRVRFTVVYKPHKIVFRIEWTLSETWGLATKDDYDPVEMITGKLSSPPTLKERFASLYPTSWSFKYGKFLDLEWADKKKKQKTLPPPRGANWWYRSAYP